MSTSPVALQLGLLYGPIFFGTVMTTAFYGVACMQTFFYYVHYENDPLRLKILVAALWALTTIHEALSVSGAYKFIIAGLMDPFPVTGIPDLILLYLVTVLVAVPTQGFLIYRVYIFSDKNIIAPLIWAILALVEFVTSIIYVRKALYIVDGVHTVTLSVLNSGSSLIVDTLTLSSAAALDVFIAVAMTFLLVRHRVTTGFQSTAHILQRLTVFAVNTGTWTATFALLTVILVHLFPTNSIYTVFILPLCSVYCNTLLGNLNGRAYVRGEELTYVESGVFRSPDLRVSDRIEGNNQRGGGKMTFSAQQTMEMMTFPDASRSATHQNM